MSLLYQYFKIKHVRILLLLIFLDLIATITWYYVFGIPEANPLLAELIKESPVKFTAVKLGLSLPGIYLLRKYIKKGVAQGGLAILLTCYYIVAIIHCVIFMTIV
tara:strand:- start:654 stop:968 length:315 start_codon:yes stop_codon:yes gene_type:complete